jgi:nucleoside-diphosphate-sugar epimerase
MGSSVLIAGGFGFIGSYVTRACLERGDDVTVLTLQRTDPRISLPSKIRRLIQVDLRNGPATLQALKNQRYQKVFNLSGYIDHTPYFRGGRAVLDQHFLAVQNLLDALDRTDLKSFVQIGSSDEYGNAKAPQKESVRETPIAPYSTGKVAAAQLLQTLYRTEAFPAVILRFFLVYGPGQDNRRFIPQVIQGCLGGKPFNVSAGRQKRDFTYVEDIAQGVLKAADTPAAFGQVINLASGQAVTVRSIIEKVVALCKQGQPQYGAVAYRPGENMALVADTTLAKKWLKWRPSVSVQEGLRRTIASFQHG